MTGERDWHQSDDEELEEENVRLNDNKEQNDVAELQYSYSQDSLQNNKGSRCQSCMARVPYATVIATVLCLLGVLMFSTTLYRGAALTSLMLDQVFHIRSQWAEAVQTSFVAITAFMGALGFMILAIGCMATGGTRQKIYRAWRSRVVGRTFCAVFMVITYLFLIFWIIKVCMLTVITFGYTMFWALCSAKTSQNQESGDCIDFRQFSFIFPEGTRPEDMQVCGPQETKLFCKDYVERAEIMFILALISSIIIVMSLVHYLVCLAANYTHIRDHEKFQELQELQYLHEPDMNHSKDRF